MKLKEIVKQAMLLLNIPPDPNDFAENAPEPTDATLISLISCANSAISDAASNYARVYKTETLSTDDGNILFSSLGENVFEPLSVFSSSGRESFRVFPDRIGTSPGEVVFAYSYIPKPAGFDGNVCLPPSVTLNALAFKTAAEFSLRNGLSDKALLFEKKYDEAARASLSGRRLGPLPVSYGGAR